MNAERATAIERNLRLAATRELRSELRNAEAEIEQWKWVGAAGALISLSIGVWAGATILEPYL